LVITYDASFMSGCTSGSPPNRHHRGLHTLFRWRSSPKFIGGHPHGHPRQRIRKEQGNPTSGHPENLPPSSVEYAL
jgi:hypothetical protein